MINIRLGVEVETYHYSGEHEYYNDEEECYCPCDERNEDADSVIESSSFFEEYHTDGSLTEGDTEFTTNVFSSTQIDEFADEVEDLLDGRFLTDETCGIHVHVDQDLFTPYSFYNLYNFFNNELYDEFVYKFGGREDGEHHYACSCPTRGLECCTDKFQRVAWRSEYNTVEFRIFASSTKSAVIKRYLNSLVELITLVAYGGARAKDILDRAERSRRYENLYNALTENVECVLQ